MDKVTKNDIEKLAALARVGLTEEEKESLSAEMTAILDYVKQLDEVDVSNTEATSQVANLVNISRKDEVIRSEISTEELLSNTPEVDNGFIKVKSVL